ncbi:MAG: hypothetical protein MHPSP_001427 [Paramarteilia canceri]
MPDNKVNKSKKLSSLLKRNPLESKSERKNKKISEAKEEVILDKVEKSLKEKAKKYDQFLSNSLEPSDESLVNFLSKSMVEYNFKREALHSSMSDIKKIKEYFSNISHRNTNKAIDIVDLDTSQELTAPSTKKVAEQIEKRRDQNLKSLLESKATFRYQHAKSETVDHGVGYFGFSKDEKKRQDQLEYLKKLDNDVKDSRK